MCGGLHQRSDPLPPPPSSLGMEEGVRMEGEMWGWKKGQGGRGEEKGSERVGWKVRNERAGNKRGE